MSSSRRVTMAAGFLLAVCMSCSVLLLRRVDGLRTHATLEEILYIPSPQVLRRLGLGYNGLLADIYWTRAVQYFGENHHTDSSDYKLLAPLLEITTALDPHLLVAYEFGSFIAAKPPGGAGLPERAIDLTEFGIRNNPDEWRLYYDLGFLYYMELKNYTKAADAFERGSRVPNAHPFLKVLAAQMATHAGEIGMARNLWLTTLETAQDANIRANAKAHLRALRVDEDITQLEALVASYREKTGQIPTSFLALQAAGMLPGIPLDPRGIPYFLTTDGRIEVRNPDELAFITKGLPPGYVPPKLPKFLPTD